MPCAPVLATLQAEVSQPLKKINEVGKTKKQEIKQKQAKQKQEAKAKKEAAAAEEKDKKQQEAKAKKEAAKRGVARLLASQVSEGDGGAVSESEGGGQGALQRLNRSLSRRRPRTNEWRS